MFQCIWTAVTRIPVTEWFIKYKDSLLTVMEADKSMSRCQNIWCLLVGFLVTSNGEMSKEIPQVCFLR
jgi:hypothetical protein